MKEIVNAIKENKQDIKDGTLKTYVSLLKSLYYKHHDKSSEINTDWFHKQDEVIELLKDKPGSSRKTTYAALIAICPNEKNDKYRKAMMEDSKEYSQWVSTQQKSKAQDENWKSFDEIKKVYDNFYLKVKPLLNSKEPLSTKDFVILQDFIILALTSGVFIAPRRSLDWCEMKIKNVDKAKDNYIDKNEFVFNQYKTAKFYSTQKVEIPKALKTILNKYIKLNPNEYLIADNTGKKLSNVRLTQKLNALFDSKISTSLLRHIYLTEKLKNVPALNELKQMAQDMAHSPMQALEYVKH
jgi:integrase